MCIRLAVGARNTASPAKTSEAETIARARERCRRVPRVYNGPREESRGGERHRRAGTYNLVVLAPGSARNRLNYRTGLRLGHRARSKRADRIEYGAGDPVFVFAKAVDARPQREDRFSVRQEAQDRQKLGA